MQTKKRIILGSASPRRRELLEQIGISFEVRVSDKEEVYHSLIPEEIVKELALSKAENVAYDLREKQEQVKQISFDKKNNVLLDTIVIGADTIVVSDGSILGKPKDEADAVRMIRSLQGRSHKVYTGVAILDYDDEGKRKSVVHAVETEVFVNPMSDEEIREYAATGEPLDKAGAYGIQGRFAAYIERIDGDYYNVVGLPISRLCRELKSLEAEDDRKE